MKQFYVLLAFCFGLSANAQIINFPDANFKAKLLAADVTEDIAQNSSLQNIKIDANNNNEIEVSEAALVYSLRITHAGISNLSGINSFTNLHYLSCYNNALTSFAHIEGLTTLTRLLCDSNNFNTINLDNLVHLEYLSVTNCNLTSLDVSNQVNIKSLACQNNTLSQLNLAGLTQLETVSCNNNQLASLDVSNQIHLKILVCHNNQLGSLDVSGLANLEHLQCENNQLQSLTLNSQAALHYLTCSNNQLTSLNATGLPNLEVLQCSQNQLQSLNATVLTHLTLLQCDHNNLTTLDVSNSPLLTVLWCDFNPNLTTLLMKNGAIVQHLIFTNNPSLNYICADEFNLELIQDIIWFHSLTDQVQANSYCNFHPGGTYYTLQGQATIDTNNNGCNSGDPFLPNLQLSVNNGAIGNFISNSSGNYSIPLQEGTHTVFPSFEGNSYYTVSPASFSVDFPATASPFVQNFCIVPNGTHNDLEIAILPIGMAQPGFDSNYKVVYKNKGTHTQSGTVSLVFNDAVLDYVSSIPAIANQSLDMLSWTFTDLQPFENREILLTLNVNSPMEIPAVNLDDVLHYTALISGLTDETPNDNTSVFNQLAVNSYDPNDKTCMEGNYAPPSVIGEYVHYMIRFENNGTANAQNVVVRDMIDTAKFDIASLRVLDSSHSMTTKITGTNKVEFIFQNINLPFDDANNDGYVAFKIKTKPTLVIGNTFTNSASIFFDYNFPIVTNTATTTIQALANPDFEFGSYVALAPNPAKEELNIQSKNGISISSIAIYNTLGQVVMAVTQPSGSIDVSALETGTYFIKINSDKGSSGSKFIKE